MSENNRPFRTDASQLLGTQTKQGSVLTYLREQIAQGIISPGDWIRPEECAKALGVSQTPVREALRHLEAAGLVTIQAHKGAQVRHYSVEEYMDLRRVRAALEALAVRMAIERASDEGLRALVNETRVLNDLMISLKRRGDANGVRSTNRELHDRINKASGCDPLLRLIENAWTSTPFHIGELNPDVEDHIILSHIPIIDAIESRNADAAAAAVVDHIERRPDVIEAFAIGHTTHNEGGEQAED